MRRFVTVFVATVAGLVVLLSFKSAPAKAPRAAALSTATPGDSSASTASSAPASSAAASSAAATPAVTSAASSSATATASSASTTTTKTVTGSTVNVREGGRSFGVVQVRLTLTNGKITAATAIQSPQNDSHSAELSQFSIPTLSQEVLTSQSASIDAVSGATYTSEAYAQSVQAALDAAKA
jgi:uncharacterized protein with FMN-binding domain